MTAQEDPSSERWYEAGDTAEFQQFFDDLVRELELFRRVHPGHVFRPNHQRFWELLSEKRGNMEPETRTWVRIVPGMPGKPTGKVKQGPNLAGEIDLDEDETRQLIGWPPPP
jgi:hypothetical protein